ncbi:MAG: 3-hydroxyacyl-CoA dehydrogenase NAD-binding domain-containing protein [Candidatus Bathyarchaeota archaeon]|jgi:enoyl-CoA hydratase/3-hydroxyacyl-CoA dehydrogenase
MSEEVERIAVLGAGTMGHGIAQVAAVSGIPVVIRDIAQEFLDGAQKRIEESLKRQVERGRMTDEEVTEVIGNLSYTLDLEEAVRDADLIIEAIPEKMDLKRRVWSEASDAARGDAILATNTSSLSITGIAEAVADPERFIGMHFFNPATLMRLVEVIPGERTGVKTVERVKAIAEMMGKTPVEVKKDVVGFIVNRILVTYLNEAARLLETESYTKEQIDGAMQHRAGMPLGPLMLSDLIGLDIVYHVLKVFEENLGPEYKPADIIEDLYKADKLGRKTGEGFYNYAQRPSVTEGEGEGFDVDLLLEPFIAEAEKVVSEGIADPESVDTALKLGGNIPKGPFEMKGGK